MELLQKLTETGVVTRTEFKARYKELFTKGKDMYRIVVLVDLAKNKVVGNGTLLLERKFIRNCGIVSPYNANALQCAHIEDIVVDETYRGKGLGKRVVNVLQDLAQHHKAYKIILDCDEKVSGFYSKSGFESKGLQMGMYNNEVLKENKSLNTSREESVSPRKGE